MFAMTPGSMAWQHNALVMHSSRAVQTFAFHSTLESNIFTAFPQVCRDTPYECVVF